MGDSEMTEPLELNDEDVFVADLEDPATKYAAITKKVPAGKKPGLETTVEEEEKPQEFCGSRLMYFSMCWCLVVVIVIVVVVRAVCPGCDSSDDAAAVPTMPTPIEPTMAPSVMDIISGETMVPTAVGTDAGSVVTGVPATDVPGATEAPTAVTPVEVTAAPTMAPTTTPVTVTAAPTDAPTSAPVATGAPTTAPVATAAPTAGEVVATTAPTAGEVAVETGSPTAGEVAVETGSPTTSEPVDLRAVLPDYSQEALLDPISPQSRAFLFVNYDPFVATRSEAEMIQRFALATIYFGLGAQGWTAGSVNPAGDECDWFADTGSLCNSEERMQSLLLASNGLVGSPIPPEIGLLTSLTEVDMSANAIAGTIPTYLGQLTMLETLRLGSNQLTGTIPTELSSIAALTTLDLSGLDFVTGVVADDLCDAATFDCRPEDLCGCECACAAA